MARILIDETNKKGRISPEIYGHFSEHLGRCIYEGLYVGENSDIPNVNGMRKDVVEALKELKIPVLRWPGGCFADEYHWRDGIGPKEKRKKMVNTHWGGVTEDNSFGTHEFFELCEQLGCKAYVNGNLGSGTVQEMSEWVEYMTFDGVSPMAELRKENGREKPWKVDYFGVGNENWGCGGNMTPEYYGNLYRRYQTYVRNYNSDAPVQKIACGPSAGDYNWTEKLLKTCFASPHQPANHGYMDGLSLHHYTITRDWSSKGSATDFTDEEWYKTMASAMYMEELITRHSAIMDRYDPEKKIGLMVDEWGCWFDVEPGTNPGFLYQQNTMRDAVVAGTTLNIFNRHCDRVRMACIAQMVNVLQSMILTEGPDMLLTPTYHVFHMYRHHQGAELLESRIENNPAAGVEKECMVPALSQSVSLDEEGYVNLTVSNLDAHEAIPVTIQFRELAPSEVKAFVLCGENNAHNTFDTPDRVKEKAYEDYGIREDSIHFTAQPGAVYSFRVK